MPLFFLIAGIILIVVGINDKTDELITLLKEDMAPSDGSIGFEVWILAIGGVGLLGSIKELKAVSNALLVLLVLVMMLGNKGFFAAFSNAVTTIKPVPYTEPTSGSGSGSSDGQNIAQDAQIAANVAQVLFA